MSIKNSAADFSRRFRLYLVCVIALSLATAQTYEYDFDASDNPVFSPNLPLFTNSAIVSGTSYSTQYNVSNNSTVTLSLKIRNQTWNGNTSDGKIRVYYDGTEVWSGTSSPHGNWTWVNSGTIQLNQGQTQGGIYPLKITLIETGGDSFAEFDDLTVEIEGLPVPAKPTLRNHNQVKPNSFNMRWNASTHATSYKIHVSESSSFSSHVDGYYGKRSNWIRACGLCIEWRHKILLSGKGFE